MNNQMMNDEVQCQDKEMKQVSKRVAKDNRISFKKTALYLFHKKIDIAKFAKVIEDDCSRFVSPPNEQYTESCGFVPPYTKEGVSVADGEICRFIDSKAIVLKFRHDSKKVPPKVLDAAFDARMRELSEISDTSFMKKDELDGIKDGIKSILIERAFPSTKETWLLVTEDFFALSNCDEATVARITKTIREKQSLSIVPLSVLLMKNLYNSNNNISPVDDVKLSLNDIIAKDLFNSEGGLLSKASFNLTSGGGEYSVSNGDEIVPELIGSIIESDREFKRAMIKNDVYSCNIIGKDMRQMTSLHVENTECNEGGGDFEDEWFNGTCLVYVSAFYYHLSNMSLMCAEA